MNKSFNILKKETNETKVANTIVKFKFNNNDYLIYSIDENDQNKQIFVSKFVTNSEGKHFIEEITKEEKNLLNNIVYNIVIIVPSNFKKGELPKNLIDGISNKFNLEFKNNIEDLEMQEYYNNCSIAITSKELVESAVSFYNEYLKEEVKEEVPTWTPPIEETHEVTPPPVNQNIPIETPSTNIEVEKTTPNEPAPVVPSPVEVQTVMPNPQVEKLAIISDPNLSNAVGIDNRGVQPNLGRNKKAGFASNKYIIIGTICIVLAILVVVAAFILIKNNIKII